MNNTRSTALRRPVFLLLVCVAALAAMGALIGCASKPTPRAAKVRVATAAEVKKCEFLGRVSGSSAHEGYGLVYGRDKAKNDALDVAAALGATHVVWIEVTDGLNPTATARAYRCSP